MPRLVALDLVKRFTPFKQVLFRDNQRGLSLVEVLLATIILAGTIIAASLLLPKSFRGVQEERYRWKAANIAASTLQQIKSIPYPLIALTPVGATPPYFTDEVSEPGGCDCATVNFDDPTVMPPPYSETIVDGNVNYTVQVCVARVGRAGGAWQHHCPPPASADPNSVAVRVRVSWTAPGQARKFHEAESIASRS